MKSSIKPAKVERTGEFEETQFGISSSEDLVYIFDILRNKLYSDKILAVIREYSTNAFDAHVEAGKPTLPVKLTMPTTMEPEFRVRDYGEGLSEEDVRTVYCMYGRSTKRNSNDFTGQLGLGSKSGFAYGENFMIISYHEGKKTTYNAYIDESRLGSIAKISEEKVSENESGVEIVIPVNRYDIREFSSKAGNCLKFFRIAPELVNGSDVDLKRSDVILDSKNWRHVRSPYYRNESTAVMGNIGYPIDVGTINFSDEERSLQQLLNCGFEIDFEIGELNIGANREALEYDKFTQVNIKRRCEEILTEIKEKVEKDIASCTSLIEAMKKASELYFGGKLGNILGDKDVTWKGKTFGNSYITKKNKKVEFVQFKANGSKVKKITVDNIDVRWQSDFAVKDTNDGWVIRSRAYIQDGGNDCDTLYLVTAESASEIKAWMKEWGFTNQDFFNLSDIEKPKIIRTTTGIARPKDKASAFTLASSCSRWGTQSDNWDPCTIDKQGKGIYVGLYRFEITKGIRDYALNAATLREEIIPALKHLGYDETKHPIHGIKENDISKLGPKWMTLREYIVSVIRKNESLKNEIIETISGFRARNCSLEDNILYDRKTARHIRATHKDLIVEGSEFEKFLDITKTIDKVYKPNKDDQKNGNCKASAIIRLNENFGLSKMEEFAPKDYDAMLQESVKRCREKYPITSVLTEYLERGSNFRDPQYKEVLENVLEYISAVENCGLSC